MGAPTSEGSQREEARPEKRDGVAPEKRRATRRALGWGGLALGTLVIIGAVLGIVLPSATIGPTESSGGTSGPSRLPAESPAPPADSSGPLDLPRIPWEGGPEYWSRFANAQEWTDPSFFPIGIWFNGISSDEEVEFDKSYGINSYAGMWEGTPFDLFERNGVYWIGDKLNDTFDEDSLNWPGVNLDDEVDGRYDPEDGIRHLEDLNEKFADSGKFRWSNYTQMVFGSDLKLTYQEQYVNLNDVVSVDMYWYTIPFCDWTPYRGELYADPVPQSTCRTSSSYGRSLNGLTIRDEVDGELQPRWMFVENLNGLSGQEHVDEIQPGQLKGAAMNAVINEARGIWWFNQSYTGECQTTVALRRAQVEGTDFCGYAQMQAMGEVNGFIHDLARIINTQSYAWDFGPGLDTMLKTYEDDAYIFAMTDGTTGSRTFTLPEGIDGDTVEVVDEDRRIPVSDGAFSDSFAEEYTYHVYRISLT